MSLSSWSYTSDLTFWPVTYDATNQPTPGTAVAKKGTWKSGGGTQKTDSAEEFVPMEVFYTSVASGETPPGRGWLVAKGVHTGPPSSAQYIKKITGWDDSVFGETDQDVAIYT